MDFCEWVGHVKELELYGLKGLESLVSVLIIYHCLTNYPQNLLD